MISMYAEYRNPSGTWLLAGKGPVLLGVDELLIFHGAWWEILDDFYEIDAKELSRGLRKTAGNLKECEVKYIPFVEFSDRCEEPYAEFARASETMYRALGIDARLEKDGCSLLNCIGEGDKKYNSNGDIRKNYSQVTFPVDKELPIDLNRKSADAYKAVMWRGILRTVRDSVSVRDIKEDLRLVFVQPY